MSLKIVNATNSRLAFAAGEAQKTVVQGAYHSGKPRRDFNQLLRIYLLTDIAAFMVAFVLTKKLGGLISKFFLGYMVDSAVEYDAFRVTSFVAIAVGCLFWFQHKGHYRVRTNFWLEVKNVLNVLCVAMIVNGFFQFETKRDFSRLWLTTDWIFAAVAIILFRGLYRMMLRRRGSWLIPTLLVGGGQTAEDTLNALALESGLGFHIVAQVANLPVAFMQAGRSWERLCSLYNADYVIIALDGKEIDEAEKPMAQLVRESVPFSISPPRRNLPVLDMVPQYFFNSDVKLLTHCSGLEQPLPRFTKRLFDAMVSGTILLLISPLFLVLAAMIKRDGGPVFFGHLRVGKNGKPFHCLKFRSMIPNSQAVLQEYLEKHPEAKAEWDATHKLKNDPRVTKFGNFLRASSLDELPQLLNVLRGEMSLVGPRPIVTAEIEKYDQDIAHYYRVTPGITGLWQVSGRNDVTYGQRVQMDSWYVRNWSLWHDIAILCKTVPALLERRGAY